MAITIKTNRAVSPDEILQHLKYTFPNYKTSSVGRLVLLKHKKVMLFIRSKKNKGIIKISSDINIKHSKVYIPLIIGIIIGVIGVIFVGIFIYSSTSKKRKKLKTEVVENLKSVF